MTEEEEKSLLPSSQPLEAAYDMAAAVSSMVPWLGGPVSMVLGGLSLGLKMERVGQVLTEVSARVKHLEAEAAKEYVQTSEFQELLERTLRQVAQERSEAKRQVYAAFLAGDIESPGEPYDEKLRVLRILEELQGDHIRVLSAMMQKPEDVSGISGSIARTLGKRLPDIPSERISDLDGQLRDLKLVSHGGSNTMMTATGAEQLFNYITPLGKRFVRYILEDR
jgi:hypothetical protein